MPAASSRGADFAARVQRWQRRHGRHDLPWQSSRDPYRVWLSEVMLQQTQVGTVLDYYTRFLQRFPGVQDLAAAPVDDVLALWSGLGYYSRARNLHRAAQQVVAQHGGRFPSSAAALQALPGIGRSTAAAIAAFCWDERVAILDGNVKRVLARVLAFGGDLARAPEVGRLWQLAEALLPPRDVGVYTQGLMDLGATVCLARAPACAGCPVRDLCAAHAAGRPLDYPVKLRRTLRAERSDAWVWLTRGDAVWLVQRPDAGVWAGLWSLPEYASDQAARAALAGLPGAPRALPPLLHRLTHRDWTLHPLHWPLPHRGGRTADALLLQLWPTGRWFARDDALALGLPAPLRRLLAADPPQG